MAPFLTRNTNDWDVTGMLHRWVCVGFVLFIPGCSTIKDVSPYGGPFKMNNQYVATGPVSAYIGDTPFESSNNVVVPDQHAARDPDVLAPGTRMRFVRKDAPYLVFLVLTGNERGRYAWVSQHSEDIPSLTPAKAP